MYKSVYSMNINTILLSFTFYLLYAECHSLSTVMLSFTVYILLC